MNIDPITNEDVLNQLEDERMFLHEDNNNDCLFFREDAGAMYNGCYGNDEDMSDCYNFAMHVTDYPESMWI